MHYERPNQLNDALALLASHRWDILSGGTDYYPGLNDRPPQTPVLDISAIGGLRHISPEDGFWRIGALATWSDVLGADLPPAFDGLKLAAREVGSVQIQNRATVAGNICNASPAADGVPPLLTLDTVVELASAQGSRRLALSDFILGNRKTAMAPGEMVTGLLIPRSSATGVSSFLKLGARKYLVISVSAVAARLVTQEGRISQAAISVGACSVVACRLGKLEQSLTGRSLSDDLSGLVTPGALADLAPIDDVRATATYRMDAAAELVRRALDMAAAGM